jgi:hypothetical protein
MFKRGLGKSDAWQGVVTDKERSSPDGQNMYHHVVVTLSDGTVKVIRVRRALWNMPKPYSACSTPITIAGHTCCTPTPAPDIRLGHSSPTSPLPLSQTLTTQPTSRLNVLLLRSRAWAAGIRR